MPRDAGGGRRLVLSANSDWFLFNFNLELMERAREVGYDVHLASPPGPYAESFAERDFPWRPIPMERSAVRPFRDIASIRKFERLYREVEPDVVHHFTLRCALLGSIAARRSGTSGVVNSITGLGYLWSSRSLKARILKAATLALSRRVFPGTEIICLNNDDLGELTAAGAIDAARARCIPGSGVDIARFDETPGLPNSIPLVVLVSRMLRSKGIEDFAAAARRLRRGGSEARFALVGDLDPDNPDALPRDQIEQWVDAGDLEWWGFRRDMPSVYAQADIMCLPATYREGVPTSLLEAAAAGLPLVATDVPGCREAVSDGRNGLLVAPGDVAALTAALETLLSDAALRTAMGRAGRVRAVEEFSVDHVVESTLAVYDEAVAGPGTQ